MQINLDQLEVQHSREDNRFYIELPDSGKAFLEYRIHPNIEPTTMEFSHTFVTKAFRNQGIASKIVESGLRYARRLKYRIRPTCPFVASYLQKHPEYKQ